MNRPARPFAGHVLDRDRGCLLRDGAEIALRPKTFAVLCHLVENAGRLVSKDELFTAVWPDVAVTDDTLVQSIGELRRALGEAGPRLIRTVPRRGYRMEADPVAEEPEPPPPALAAARTRVRPLPYRTAALALLILAVVGGAWAWLRPGAEVAAPRGAAAIAVLPLVDRDGAPEGGRLADGMTQDMINALGRFSALTVMSWNAVLPYRGRTATPETIGRTLAVGYLLEGSMRRAGDRVRVAVQLVEAGPGRVLWSDAFEDVPERIFVMQDGIVGRIVGALAVRVTQAEQRRALARPPEQLEAWDLLLRARPALLQPTRAGTAEARELLRRAVALDPGWAAAHAALAETWYNATAMGWAESPSGFMRRAEEAAMQALALDDGAVRARVVLGRIHMAHQRLDPAETEMRRAVDANPGDADGLAGLGNILVWAGRTDEAIELLERALRINPDLGAIDRFALALAYYLKRRYPAAIEQGEIARGRSAGAPFARVVLAAAYAQSGYRADAARVAAEVRRLDPTFAPWDFGTKLVDAGDLAHLRDGLRKAQLDAGGTPKPPSGAPG